MLADAATKPQESRVDKPRPANNGAWLKLSAMLLRREWYRGQLRLMALSLALAVATVVAIALLAAQLQGAVNQRSSAFIAADRVLRSAQPVPAEWLQQAQELGLEQAEMLQFSSMAFAGDEMLLSSVKAVSESYPLRGELKVSDEPFGEVSVAETGPMPGELWLAPRLFNQLGVSIGDSVEIGNAEFTVAQILAEEPDAPFNVFAGAPRILMNMQDVDATGVVQPGSRLSWRYLFAGEDKSLNQLGDYLKDKTQVGQRYYGVEGSSSPMLADSLERTRSYLLLACLLAVGLACTAVAIAANRYCDSQTDGVAVMKTLGAGSKQISQIYLAVLTGLSITAILLGCLMGTLLQWGLVEVLGDLLPQDLPPAGWQPYWLGILTGGICAVFFTVYPLLRLVKVPALKVLRHEAIPMGGLGWLNTVAGLGALFVLMWLYSQNFALAVVLMGGTCLMGALLWAFGQWLIVLLRKLAPVAGRFRLALAALERRRRANSLVLIAFSLAIMLTMLLTMLRGDLIRDWQLQLPPETPNHFLINIAPEEVGPIQERLQQSAHPATEFYPIIRGRLVEINGNKVRRGQVQMAEEPAAQSQAGAQGAQSAQMDAEDSEYIEDDSGEQRSDESIRRELSLTWQQTRPPEGSIIAGQWWDEMQAAGLDTSDAVSIEQGVAERLGVGLGDKLGFQIGSLEFTTTVTSIRAVEWDSMQPNFYMIFAPGVLDQFPATWIGSFYLPTEDKPFVGQLMRDYPTVTVLEVDRLIDQILSVIDQVTAALELVLITVMIAGGLVLVACVQISLSSREQELALLRTLGARNRQLWQSFAAEFLLLGGLAGLLAAAATQSIVRVLQSQIFEMEPVWHPWLWLTGPLLGAGLITALALLSLRHLLGMSALTLLRRQA